MSKLTYEIDFADDTLKKRSLKIIVFLWTFESFTRHYLPAA